MASKNMGRSTTVNSIFRFRSHAFVVNITTPSGRIDLPSKLARGFSSRLIFGAGCSSDRSVSCEMMLTALPVSTRIFERAIPPTSNAITKASSWGTSSFTVSCMGAFIGIIDLPCRDRFIRSGEFGIGRSDAIRLDSVGIHSRT
ncbi:hypothetical protein F2Q69_00023978 [Brassica cretica]|uniref:Uncharacterized protein n=1 Tax=Brassica cretica TaxID=69181 RepID=A0A8S9QIL7_BRACR|nr:hypothetical protein F2Q69_00023978 [Brassica cretica]